MKYLIILLSVLLHMGCVPESKEITHYQTMVIENCEYIYLYGSLSTFTHKGNCSNPIHGGRE